MWESADRLVGEGFFEKEPVDGIVCIFSERLLYPQKYLLSTELYASVQGYSVVIQWLPGVFLL